MKMIETLSFKELQCLTQEAVEKFQELRFRAVVRNFLPFTRFYKKLFSEFKVDFNDVNSVEDWHKKGLPLIKKSVYMKHPEDFIVRPDKSRIFKNHLSFLKNKGELGEAFDLLLSSEKKKILKEYYSPKMILFSGGTESGYPTPVFITAKEKRNLLSILESISALLIKNYFKGCFDDERTVGMNLFPYGPHLAWHAVHHALDIGADLNLCTAAGGAIPSERLVLLAGKTKPNIICGMNEYIRNRWLPLAIEKKIKLPEKTVFINGAQKMCDSERKQIKDLARKVGVKECVVLDFYGASELNVDILPECSPNSGFHQVAPLSNIIKTVRIGNEDVGKTDVGKSVIGKSDDRFITDWDFDESGYGVVWNIGGAGTSLQGYLLGDYFEKMAFDICPHCNLNTLRIYNVSRIREVEAQLRLTGMVEEKIKGSRVNLLNFRERALSLKDVKEAQVVLDRTGKFDKLFLFIVSDNVGVVKKLKNMFSASEIVPEIRRVSLKSVISDKMKFEGVVVKNK